MRTVRVLAVVVALGAGLTWVLLPPRPLASAAVDWQPARPVVAGAYHVHTVRSDGSGTWQEVAEAAARAGLDFVIITDHGDGTERREPPRSHAGVLLVDGVEVSTTAGHLVVIPPDETPAPYPLAGEPHAVVEDAARVFGPGTIVIVAHPGSPREQLRWNAWDDAVEALEWLNADSEWRDEGARLGRTLVTFWIRPVETLAALVNRPDEVLRRWDQLTTRRPVRALAGHDAHARLAFGRTDPYEDTTLLQLPSYETSFRAFSNRVVLDRPFSGDAAADARLLLDALRRGAVYTTIDGLAAPGPFEFTATADGVVTPMGEIVRAPLGDVGLHARVGAPAGTRLVLLRGGGIVAESTGGDVRAPAGASGAYRVEAYLPGDNGRGVPWLVSNPIYVDRDDRYAPVDAPPPPAAQAALDLDAGWHVETGAGSTLDVEALTPGDGPPALRLSYRLGDGTPAGQFAALRLPVPPGLREATHIGITTSADREARVWLQLRRTRGADGERWGRSVAVPAGRHTAWAPLDGFRPLGVVSRETPPLDDLDDLLIVVDTVNARPGATGTFVVWNVTSARR